MCVCVCVCVSLTASCRIDVLTWSFADILNVDNNTCKHGKTGYVKLNGAASFYSQTCGPLGTKYRGVHIVLIDPFACSMIGISLFDTFRADGGTRLRDHLDAIDDYKVIVGLTINDAYGSGSGGTLHEAYDALKRIGVVVDDVAFRGSFAFVAQKHAGQTKTLMNKALNESLSHTDPAKLSVIVTGTYVRSCSPELNFTISQQHPKHSVRCFLM